MENYNKLAICFLSLVINIIITAFAIFNMSNTLITILMPCISFIINLITYKLTRIYKSFICPSLIHMYFLFTGLLNFDSNSYSLIGLISGIIILGFLFLGIYENASGYIHTKRLLSIFRPFK